MRFSQICFTPLVVASVLAAPTQRHGHYTSEGEGHHMAVLLDRDLAYNEPVIDEQRFSRRLDGDLAYIKPEIDEQRHSAHRPDGD
ncbi:hypothetical protein MMC22_010679 [Lobaria immixta]|nr:hypothetical protein [Lobaria immixta]